MPVKKASPANSRSAGKQKKEQPAEEPPVLSHEQSLIPKVEPKKPSSAYLFYSNATRPHFMSKGFSITEASKKIGEEWKLLTDAGKAKYVKMADQDKLRFEKEMNELNSKGYFVNSDGIKSTDILPKLS